MNVHYRSSPHKKDYGVLLSLQACSCKSARLGVVRATAEEGQSYSPSAQPLCMTLLLQGLYGNEV